jgi:hypothetical protein
MLAPVVAITWGYAAGDLTRTPGTLWTLVTDYSGVLLATGGTAALVMVVVTSVRAARRRIRYEPWHLLHLYAYLGVGLALPHQLWTGQQLVTSPARTFFWWASGGSPPSPCWCGGWASRCGATCGTGWWSRRWSPRAAVSRPCT